MFLFVNEQVVYMALVGSFPFNSFLSGVLSCVGTAVLAGKCACLVYHNLRLACYAYLYTHIVMSLLSLCAYA